MPTLLTDSKDDDMSLEELWIFLNKLSSHIVEDNKLSNNIYPTDVRKIQLTSIQTLINSIQKHH